MIKKLIALADRLDMRGFKKEANFIDNLIKKFADNDYGERGPETAGDCDYRVDECHFCYALSGSKYWLCAGCRLSAQRMGLSEKEYAYSDIDDINNFDAQAEQPIVEDLTELPEEETEGYDLTRPKVVN